MDLSITIEDSEPCISKVHVGLCSVKPKAFKPVLVSIGPYHKANPSLEEMQQNKILYLNSLLERRNKRLEQKNKSLESREIYQAKLANFDSKARKCYVDPYPVNSNGEFVEMMLLDGCFIVEFFRKIDDDVDVEFDENDPIFKVPWRKNQIKWDMMLLENQLPYFVLSEFYNMTKYKGEKPLEEMAISCFNFMLPRPRLNSNNAFGNINTEEIHHLLHLIHVFCRPFPEKTPKKTIKSNKDSDKSYEMKSQMGTVVELQEAGVQFKKVGKIYNGALKKKTEEDKCKKVGTIFNCALKKKKEDQYVSLFDIAFKCGVMKVPCFKVDDGTETLLRNLIAYEQHFQNLIAYRQHSPNVEYPMYFTDFASLMNQLINSNKDAKVLRFEGIIMNFLGGDDELSQLFNRLTDYVCGSYEPYYLEVRQKVDKHCKTICNTWMAYFNSKYFNNPWAGISTFAAVFLLLLTVVQTVVALISWLA